MHDSASPSPSPDPQSPEPAPGPGGDSTVGAEEAHQIVGAVLAWYSQQLLRARRSDDQQRLEELKTQRQKCVEDQHRLQDAGPEEITRIAALYAERFKKLEDPES